MIPISCHAALERSACAPFIKERRMKRTSTTNSQEIGMSRGQSTQAFNTASNENATDFGNAQSAFGSTEDAIGNYNNQLAKFVSGNPYTQGGEYDQTINTGLANVSDAGANSLAGRAAIAGPADGAEQRRRCGHSSGRSAAEHARPVQRPGRRRSNSASPAKLVITRRRLGASAVPISANQSLYGTSSNAADSVLGDETQAAKTPSFWDEVGNSVAGNLGKVQENYNHGRRSGLQTLFPVKTKPAGCSRRSCRRRRRRAWCCLRPTMLRASGPGESTPLTGNLAKPPSQATPSRAPAYDEVKPQDPSRVRRYAAAWQDTSLDARSQATPDRSGDPQYVKVSSKGQVGYLPKANLRLAQQIDSNLKVLDEG